MYIITEKNFKNILSSLNIGTPNFWKFIEGKVKRYPLLAHDFGWGCFSILNDDNILIDIRLLVPKIVDKETLLVNIHEFTHAFELYQKLGCLYIENIEESEKYAKQKEKEYLEKIK